MEERNVFVIGSVALRSLLKIYRGARRGYAEFAETIKTTFATSAFLGVLSGQLLSGRQQPSGA
jgi:hypothetical protein